MKHVLKFMAVALLSSTAFAAVANADPLPNSWYVGGSGDATWMDHSKTGGGGNADVGYNFHNMRLEGEFGYHEADGEDHRPSSQYYTYMGNAIYNLNTMSGSYGGWQAVPYIGGGIGDATIRRNGDDDNQFAYQGLAGVAFTAAAMPSTEWSVGYRYFATQDHNPHANNLELGVGYHF